MIKIVNFPFRDLDCLLDHDTFHCPRPQDSTEE
jgi:hypothetical protein